MAPVDIEELQAVLSDDIATEAAVDPEGSKSYRSQNQRTTSGPDILKSHVIFPVPSFQRLQTLCEELGPEQMDALLRRWLGRFTASVHTEDRGSTHGFILPPSPKSWPSLHWEASSVRKNKFGTDSLTVAARKIIEGAMPFLRATQLRPLRKPLQSKSSFSPALESNGLVP